MNSADRFEQEKNHCTDRYEQCTYRYEQLLTRYKHSKPVTRFSTFPLFSMGVRGPRHRAGALLVYTGFGAVQKLTDAWDGGTVPCMARRLCRCMCTQWVTAVGRP